MKSLRRDLIERRMWPLVALLIAAVIGVPMMLLRGPTPASGAASPPPPRVTAPSPAGSTGHAVVPVKVLNARIPSNPFAAGNSKAAAGPATLPASQTSSSTATTTSPTAATTSSPTATVTPSPAASSPAVTPAVASGTPSTTPTTSSASTTTTASSSPTATTTTPTTDGAPDPPTAWTIYAVDVRFGKRADAPVRSDLTRLTLLPSAPQPAVMFMGVMSGGRQAVFALGAGVTHRGPGLCRPDHTRCSAIVLSAGQSEQLTVPTAAGGPLREILRLVRIRSTVTHSRSAALAAYHRHSAAGQCDLQLADPVLYNSTQGTLSAAADCRQQRWAIAFPHPLSAP